MTNTLCSELIWSFIYINNGEAWQKWLDGVSFFGTFRHSGPASVTWLQARPINSLNWRLWPWRWHLWKEVFFLSNLTTGQASNLIIKLHKTKSYIFCVRFHFVMFSDMVWLPTQTYSWIKILLTMLVVFRAIAFIHMRVPFSASDSFQV